MYEFIDTYKGHLVPNWNQNGVLDAVSQHANDDVKAIRGKWREYPGSGVECVVADRDKKSNKTYHTAEPTHE